MSSSGDLERMQSLSSAGHYGGVRVFHDTVEIARPSTQRGGFGWCKEMAFLLVEKMKAGLILMDFI